MNREISRLFEKNKRGLLKPAVIFILRHSELNGKEMLDEIQKMSLGIWRPSPGSLYPTLDQLEKEGIITKNRQGKYKLTSSGRKIVFPWEERFYKREDLEREIREIEGYVAYLADVKSENKEKLERYRRRLTKVIKELQKIVGE